MLDLDPYLLRAFLSVAEIGTVNGAAATLNRTQAAVSMQIRKLEGLIGVALFDRSPKGLALTPDGQMLMPYAREILALNDSLKRRLSGDVEANRIRLGVVEDFAASRLIDILRDFRDGRPQVAMDVIVEPNKRLAAMLENDQLDIAICDASRIQRRPLQVWKERLLWTARADLVLPETALPIVMFEPSCPWRGPCMAALAAAGTRWSVACDASTLVAMTAAVRVGLGIGPMFADTIPPGCRAIGRAEGLPDPVAVDIGLYVHPGRSEDAERLARLIVERVTRE